MAYMDRFAFDADAHIMETPNWLRSYADPAVRERIEIPGYANELRQTGDSNDPETLEKVFERLAERHAAGEFTEDDDHGVMRHKNFAAMGSFIAEDRPEALDRMGVAAQLVFNTFHNRRLYDWERGDDMELAYGAARAHNRGMLEFCSVDPRLLATCYVPLADFDRARDLTAEAIEEGAGAILVASGPPRHHSPTHVELDPVWAQVAEAGIPLVFHVGGNGDLIEQSYFNNGLPLPPDFHGGEENFRSVDYMAIPGPPAQTLATMIFDGVLDRFEELRIGVIEQGSVWVPSWVKQMESAVEAFARHEDRIKALKAKPGEYLEHQIRVTPYPTEDIGWVTQQVGPNVLLFNTDYPHVEGGRRPYERFEASLGDVADSVKTAFYETNFRDLMGSALSGATE